MTSILVLNPRELDILVAATDMDRDAIERAGFAIATSAAREERRGVSPGGIEWRSVS